MEKKDKKKRKKKIFLLGFVSRLFRTHYQYNYELQRNLLSMVLHKKRCSVTWLISAPRTKRWRGKGDSWCFCLVPIFIDSVLIGLMSIYHYCHNWIPDRSCLVYCFWFAEYLFQMCAVLCHLPICHNQVISFSRVMEDQYIKRLKTNRSQDRVLWYILLYWVFGALSAIQQHTAFCYQAMIKKW